MEVFELLRGMVPKCGPKRFLCFLCCGSAGKLTFDPDLECCQKKKKKKSKVKKEKSCW